MFLSTVTNKVDKKGRVSVPALFRTVLTKQDNDFGGVILFRSHKYAALEGCGMERLQKLSAGVDGLDLFSDEQDDLLATIFADARPLQFDGDGRILLPSELAAHANITNEACFVGRGATFQIWEPAAFTVQQEQARARLQESGVQLKI